MTDPKRTPDFTPATIPFTGDMTAWSTACLWRGYGDLILETTVENTKRSLREMNVRVQVDRVRLRRRLYQAFLKRGWTHDRLAMMGFVR